MKTKELKHTAPQSQGLEAAGYSAGSGCLQPQNLGRCFPLLQCVVVSFSSVLESVLKRVTSKEAATLLL